MITDIVIPQRNEQQMMAMAVRLGYSCLVLAYKSKPDSIIPPPQGLCVLRVSLDKPAPWAQFTIARARYNSRGLLEQRDIHALIDMESTSPKDFMHQRASGLNHVLCGIASRASKIIVFDVSLLLNYEGQDRSILMGRMSQNIRLCTKAKTPMAIASMAAQPYRMRSPHDLMALFTVLGMHPKQSRDAIEIISNSFAHSAGLFPGSRSKSVA